MNGSARPIYEKKELTVDFLVFPFLFAVGLSLLITTCLHAYCSSILTVFFAVEPLPKICLF